MRDQPYTINGFDESIVDGRDPEPSSYYAPLDQIYSDPHPPYPRGESEFMEGFEKWLDNCASVAVALVLSPFLLMLVFLSLPILIPYSAFYLVKHIKKGRKR